MDGPHEPAHLFVYGTLQPGRLRWPFLEPFALRAEPAAVPGVLFDSGLGWPLARFHVAPVVAPARVTLVPGTLVALDVERLTVALTLLDDVEDTASGDYTRIVVTTTSGVASWAYHCSHVPPHAPRIERWEGFAER